MKHELIYETALHFAVCLKCGARGPLEISADAALERWKAAA